MSNLDKLVEELSKLTVLEAAELSKKLETAWGVSAAAPVAVAAASSGGGGDAAPVQQKTTFDVLLESFGSAKIAVIKEIREITGLGLKEAKDLVEAAPKVVKEGVDKAAAEDIKNRLTQAGATVAIK